MSFYRSKGFNRFIIQEFFDTFVYPNEWGLIPYWHINSEPHARGNVPIKGTQSKHYRKGAPLFIPRCTGQLVTVYRRDCRAVHRNRLSCTEEYQWQRNAT